MAPPQTVCHASVWPHRHSDDPTGPLDVKIGCRSLPPVVRDWPKGNLATICLTQPDERTNLTVLKVAFGEPPAFKECAAWYNEKWHNVRQCRFRRDGSLKLYIKSRITRQMGHPIPRGRWEGIYSHTDSWCLFVFQAVTLRLQPTQPSIILPSPEEVKQLT